MFAQGENAGFGVLNMHPNGTKANVGANGWQRLNVNLFFFVHHTWDLFAECHPLNRWSRVDHITPADDEKIKPFTYHIHL